MSERNNNETTINEITVEDEVIINNEVTIVNEPNDNKFIIVINDELSLELPKNSRVNTYIRDTENNKFIGFIDIRQEYPEIPIGHVYIYEKYIVIEERVQHGDRWFVGEFYVYEYDENLKIMEYKNLGKELYSSPYRFRGIHDDLLFVDIGTGPGIRTIEIFDLADSIDVLNAYYFGSFHFHNNVVSGLILSEWDIRNILHDDSILSMFTFLKQGTAMPKETSGLFPEFVLKYSFNTITKEIDIISGGYILTE